MTVTTPAASPATESPVALDPPWCFRQEHIEWRARVREFAETTLAPTVAERTIARRFDEDLVPAIGRKGYFGVRVSTEYGGLGKDLTSMCVMLEEIARVDGSASNLLEAQSVMGALFEAMASDEQKREYLPAIASGEALIAFGLTEPSGGSDAGNMSTHAERNGGDWILNGAKDHISTLGTRRSRHVIVFAATGPGRGPGRPDVTAFLVPVNAPGVSLSEPYAKLGWAAADTRSITLEDVRVPDAAVLGEVGRGYSRALELVTWARLVIGAMAVGIMQGCLDATLPHVRTRVLFGRPIGEFQDAAFKVSDMVAKLSMARALVYDGCYRHDRGLDYRRQASAAKLIAARFANEVGFEAIELHGARGLVEDYAVARLYGDARVLTIGEGPEAVQKMLIARYLGLRA